MKHIIIGFLLLVTFQCIAQDSTKTNLNKVTDKTELVKEPIFPEKCLGVWEGMMYIYAHSQLKDSVKVRFTAAKTDTIGTYIWKKEYLSLTRPMVKDYKLIVDDLNKGRYLLDEGNGIELLEFNVGNKLYSAFQVGSNYLTSSTELVGDTIVFEVTSGQRTLNETEDIETFSFSFVQRVVFHRVE